MANGKLLIIFLCLLTLISPIFLLWNIEISMIFNPEVYFTNGFITRNPIQVYHLWVYTTLGSIFALVSFVLFNLNKLVQKEK